MQFREKEVSSLSTFGNVLTLETAPGNFLILCQMVLLPNIDFLISKPKKKTTKIDPKMMKLEAGIDTFSHTLSFTQNNRALELNINAVSRYINISTLINCIYSLSCFCFDTNILTGFHVWYVPGSNIYYINSKDTVDCI